MSQCSQNFAVTLCVVILSDKMGSYVIFSVIMQCPYIEDLTCHYDECRKRDCHYNECYNGNCHYAQCSYLLCHFDKSRYPD